MIIREMGKMESCVEKKVTESVHGSINCKRRLNPQNNFERNFDKRFDKNVSFCFCRVLPSINVCILLSNTPAQFSSDAKQLLHFVSRPAAAALCPLD